MRINEIAKYVGVTHMSFAKEEELMNIFGLISSSVSPFGIINDKENKVTLVIADELKGNKLLFHSNRNTATVSVYFNDLIKFVEHENYNYVII